jgi:hypothetical protein
LPQKTSEKPIGDFPNIPEGAKLNDEEGANLMSYNLASGVTFAARGLSESIRTDVGLIFSKIILKKTMAGLTVKDYLDRHKWLRVPPYYKAQEARGRFSCFFFYGGKNDRFIFRKQSLIFT